jgi:hypothetical protein
VVETATVIHDGDGYASSPVGVAEDARITQRELFCPGVFGNRISVSAPGAVEICLFDPSGRLIFIRKGDSAIWATSELAQGVYFITARWEDEVKPAKAVRIR